MEPMGGSLKQKLKVGAGRVQCHMACSPWDGSNDLEMNQHL